MTVAGMTCVSVEALAHFLSGQTATGVRRNCCQPSVESRQWDNAALELVANPKNPVKLHTAFDCETTKTAITCQQRPSPALGNGEGKRVRCRKLLSFTSYRRSEARPLEPPAGRGEDHPHSAGRDGAAGRRGRAAPGAPARPRPHRRRRMCHVGVVVRRAFGCVTRSRDSTRDASACYH